MDDSNPIIKESKDDTKITSITEKEDLHHQQVGSISYLVIILS
jgi:hypothetical protein